MRPKWPKWDPNDPNETQMTQITRMTRMTQMTQMTQMTGWQEASQTIDRTVYFIGKLYIEILTHFAETHVWDHNKRPTLKKNENWWTHEFSIGREPNHNGDCVFKDGYREDAPEEFGWADYPCYETNWNDRAIFALCETASVDTPRESMTRCISQGERVNVTFFPIFSVQ